MKKLLICLSLFALLLSCTACNGKPETKGTDSSATEPGDVEPDYPWGGGQTLPDMPID